MFDLGYQRVTFEKAALEWVIQNINQFTVAPLANDLKVLRAVKPVADLAQLAEIMARTPRYAEIGSSLLDHCWNELAEGEVLTHLTELGDTTLVLASVYPPFFRTQRRNSRLEHRIATIRASDVAQPSHQLPLANVIAEIGEIPPWSLPDLYRQQWKKLTYPDRTLSLWDAYALAHNVFYATAFGARPEGLFEAQRQFFENRIDSVFNQFLVKENLDVVAELSLMARQHIPKDVPDIAWTRLMASQHDDGMVPKMLTGADPWIDDSGKAYSRFRNNYHTTLVSIAACVSGSGQNECRL